MKAPPEDILYQLATKDPVLSRMIGLNMFPDVAPADAVGDYMVYQRIDNIDATAHDGYGDLSEMRYQLTYWSEDSARRKLGREAVLNVFRAFSGTVLETEVTTLLITDRSALDDGPPRRYGAQLDLSVSM